MAKPKTTTQLNTWQEDMAKSASIAAKAESKLVERPFFSLGNGQLKLQGAIFPNAEAPVIMLADIHANLYYEGDYNPNSPESPACFAFGSTDEQGNIVGIDTWNGKAEMAPHKDVKERVCDTCAECPMNQFGSARMGQGKACQNTRRIATIPAGTIARGGDFEAFSKPEHFESSTMAYVKLPTTSTKTYSRYVKETAEVLGRPLWAVFSLLRVVPNAGKALPSHVAAFENLGEVPNTVMAAVYERWKQAVKELPFPFAPREAKPKAAAKPAGRRKYT